MNRVALAVAAGLAIACGSDHSGVSGRDIAAYRSLAEAVSSRADTYAAAAAAANDSATCLAAQHGYDGDVRSVLDRMRDLSGAMDDHMDEMHGTGDLACGADAARAELDRHAAVACPSDMVAAHLEAAAHVAAMHTWMDHQERRCDEMDALMGTMMGGPAGTTACTCTRNADGTFAMGECGTTTAR